MSDSLTDSAADEGTAAHHSSADDAGAALLELSWNLRAQLAWLESLGVREIPLLPMMTGAGGSAAARSASASLPRSAAGRSPQTSASQSQDVRAEPIRRAHPPMRAESPAADMPDPDESIIDAGDFAALTEAVRACSRCPLSGTRQGFLAGNGVNRADLMFVGERTVMLPDGTPGLFEPPVTDLLEKMVRAMGRDFREVACVDAVQCACGGNMPFEAPRACRPLLLAAIRFVRPRVIISLGKTATQTLLNISEPITRLRGTWRRCAGIPVMPTFHPAYLLQHTDAKRQAWDDLKQVMRVLSGEAPLDVS